MKVSDDLTKEFDQHLEQKNEKLNVGFSVNILQVLALFSFSVPYAHYLEILTLCHIHYPYIAIFYFQINLKHL